MRAFGLLYIAYQQKFKKSALETVLLNAIFNASRTFLSEYLLFKTRKHVRECCTKKIHEKMSRNCGGKQARTQTDLWGGAGGQVRPKSED